MIAKNRQLYSIPTYDAAFKWILSEPDVQPSFFHAFIPKLQIEKAVRLDDHMSPLQLFQLLRHFVHNRDTEEIIAALQKAEAVEVHVKHQQSDLRLSPSASKLLQDFLDRFEDMRNAFPKDKFDGTMDFVCELSNGEYALVEMQVTPQDYWDERAFAYIAAFFGNQLREGGDWSKIKKVIGINILGGGKENRAHWPDTPDQYVRHYRVQEQLHKDKPRFIQGIELIQYSLANAPKDLDTQEQKDWVTFFKNAHNMTEEEVRRTIKTPAVLKAFERAKIQSFPREVREKYEAEDKEYNRYSIHTKKMEEESLAKGLAKGRAEERAKAKQEKVKLQAKIEQEKEKAKQEKIELQTKIKQEKEKAKQEKIELQAKIKQAKEKAKQEKMELQAQVKQEKTSLQAKLAKRMKAKGFSVTEIAEDMDLPVTQVHNLLGK